MIRKILHLDLDAFFCAVEEQRDPTLIGKPFAVGGKPDQRGVVASCSYAARKFGVRSAMPMSRAVYLCPDLVIIKSRHGVYGQVSRQVMDQINNITPVVEQISIDEAFLDVSDLLEPGEFIARKLQNKIRAEINLPCSIGVATNKLIAKTANDYGKAAYKGDGPPNAITVVQPGKEGEFLAPLPVDALWGIGPKSAIRLEKSGIKTIGDLADKSEIELTGIFGKLGHDISLRAKGIDKRPVVTHHETKSISQETTFARDINDEDQLKSTIFRLSEGVGRRLRKANLVGTTIKLKIRMPDFTTFSRQLTLETPTDQDNIIFNSAIHLFENVWKKGQPVRLIGVGISNLGPPLRQLNFWDNAGEKDRRLQDAVDSVRERFGRKAIQRGYHLEYHQDE